MAGDIIIAVNDTPLSGISLETGIKLLKGEEGTTAHLTIKRGFSQFAVDVVRSRFTLPTVEWKVQDDNIGYIKINSFGAETGQEFAFALSELSSHKLTGYIIDLRNNGGGFVDAVLEIAGFFIGNSKAVSFKDASDISFSYNASLQPEQIKDKPVVFLANRYSASASELLLAAVKDYKAGMIIGEKTYGKGSMQDFFKLSNNDILKLTVARFYSPNGIPVDKVGVSPDIQAESILDEQAALLVMCDSCDSIDKSGFVKVSFGGIGYEIELNNGRTEENWLVYSHILNGVMNNNGKLMLGTRSGWRDIPKDYWAKPWMLYYPNYSELPGLKDVPSDKHFTITFNKQVPVENVTNVDIELIHSITGERIPMYFEQAEQNSILATPTSLLDKGQTYYLAIHPSIKDKEDHFMQKGSVTQVNVR
jgi:carboxyl-terminal processing protease